MTPAFNEHVERAANGWGPAPAGTLVTTHTANPPAAEQYMCVVCCLGPKPLAAWPQFDGVHVCGGCYPLLGHTLRRV